MAGSRQHASLLLRMHVEKQALHDFGADVSAAAAAGAW